MILNYFKVLFPVCCKAERTKPQEVNTGSIQCSKHLNMDTSTAWNGIYWGQLLPSFARGLGRHFSSVLQLLKQFSDVQPDPNLLPAPTSQGSYSAWRKSGFDRFLHLKKKKHKPKPWSKQYIPAIHLCLLFPYNMQGTCTSTSHFSSSLEPGSNGSVLSNTNSMVTVKSNC